MRLERRSQEESIQTSTNFVVKESTIQGKGLFAAKNFKPGFLEKITAPAITFEQYENKIWKLGMNPRKRENFLSTDEKVFDIRGSDLRFMNHSDSPNISWDENNLIALRKIAEGEELTIDYGWDSYRWEGK